MYFLGWIPTSSKARAISNDMKEEVKLMLNMKANKKLIQQHISERTGKSVTLKDIHNMSKKRHGGLPELIEEMQNKPSAVIIQQ